MAQEFKLIGDVALKAKLDSLRINAANKIMKRAIAAGCRVVMSKAKEKATPGYALSEEATGLMRKAIRIKLRTSKEKEVYGKIYVSRKVAEWSGRYNGRHVPGNVAHLVEFGHGGPHPAPAHPFMRPALDESKSGALRAITEKARSELNKAV
jgi:HK97 gp10 family phage protein